MSSTTESTALARAVGGIETLELAPAMPTWDRSIRALDLALGGLALIAVVPLLLIIALAIKINSPGPVIFRQRRLGRDARAFTVLKFRTMRSGAGESRHEEYVRTLINNAPAEHDERQPLYKLVVDDRITGVGRVLRKLSLDELPQIWNVLRGEMSLVGPRPVIPYEAEIYPDWYRERFGVKPGITGLWQVSGRNRRTYEEMVKLDIEFARRRTLGLYLTILARTVPVVFMRKGVA